MRCNTTTKKHSPTPPKPHPLPKGEDRGGLATSLPLVAALNAFPLRSPRRP